MNLKALLSQGRLRKHKTSKEEISNLLELIDRDIKDAKIKGLSADRKFVCAYNAALQLATIILYCKGYRSWGVGHHFTVFQAVKGIVDSSYHKLIDYFDSCRAKRNMTDYDYAGGVSDSEARELIKEAEGFLEITLDWLKTNYPNLLEK